MPIRDGKPYTTGSGHRRHVTSPSIGGTEPIKIMSTTTTAICKRKLKSSGLRLQEATNEDLERRWKLPWIQASAQAPDLLLSRFNR